MDIWVPFSMSASEDGTIVIANKVVNPLIRDYSLRRDESGIDVKLRISKDNCAVSIPGRWAEIWLPREMRLQEPESVGNPVLKFRAVRYIYVNENNYVVALDEASEVAVPDGLTVVMNSLPEDEV